MELTASYSGGWVMTSPAGKQFQQQEHSAAGISQRRRPASSRPARAQKPSTSTSAALHTSLLTVADSTTAGPVSSDDPLLLTKPDVRPVYTSLQGGPAKVRPTLLVTFECVGKIQ